MGGFNSLPIPIFLFGNNMTEIINVHIKTDMNDDSFTIVTNNNIKDWITLNPNIHAERRPALKEGLMRLKRMFKHFGKEP